jgi:hypothetical protein
MSTSSLITVTSPIAIENQNLFSLSPSDIGGVLNLKATGSPRIGKTSSVHLITIFGALSERCERA